MKSLIFTYSHALLDHLHCLNAFVTVVAAPASVALPPSRALEAMVAIFTLGKLYRRICCCKQTQMMIIIGGFNIILS